MNFQHVEFELSAGTREQLPASTFPEIVFSGKSNVGKSSLINKLGNRKALARVSATPGKTATINFYRLPTCRFVDLPGYGYARVSKIEKDRWARLVNGYFGENRNVALVLQLVDMRHPPTSDDMDMVHFLMETGLPFSVVCTKADKLNRGETERQTALYQELFASSGIDFYPVSSVKGTGIEQVQKRIERSVEQARMEG